MKVAAAFGGLLAISLGLYLSLTSPSTPTPDAVPDGSLLSTLPPWPAFRIVLALNDVFRRLTEATTPPLIRALELSNTFWPGMVARAMLEHGTLDVLAQGPASCHSVANQTGKDSDFLCRFMHAAATIGILRQQRDTYALTLVGDALRTSARDSTIWFQDVLRDTYNATAMRSVASGNSGAYERFGKELWDWHKDHQLEATLFDRAMVSLAGKAAAAVVGGLAFDHEEVLCDVGGGVGTLVSIILQHYPNASAILFDLPETAARAKEHWAKLGLENRLTVIPGSFLDNPLPHQLQACTTIFLKQVLHNWDDVFAVRILSGLKAVAAPGTRLAIIETVLGNAGPYMERYKAFLDTAIMTTSQAGAKERTFDQYAHLLQAANILEDDQPPTLLPLRDILSVITATF